MAKKNKIAGLILCVIFAIALFMAFSFPNQSSYFPKIVCTLGLLLSLLLIGLAFSAEKKGTSEEVEPLSPKARKRIFLVSALIILYAIGINVLGFAVSTFIYMVINSVILYPEKLSKDNKKPMIIILVSALLVSVLITVVFKQFLYIPLPTGLLI